MRILGMGDERPAAKITVLLLPAEPGTIDDSVLPEAPADMLKPVEADRTRVKTFQILSDGRLTSLITAQAGEEVRSAKLAYEIVTALKACEAGEVLIVADDAMTDRLPILLRGLGQMDYRFDQHKEKSEEEPSYEFTLIVSDPAAVEELVQRQKKLAEAVKFTRRLVDEPANVITPVALAAEAEAMAKETGLECEIFDEDEIQAKGMEAYYSVAKGSDAPPRFIILRHHGGGDGERLVLVGKGLCYDSGGYAIKSATGMVTMHTDMAGSAAVLGAMKFLAETKAPVNVTAVVAAAENMISGRAYRNGDIIGSLAGKSIEVNNTDAEGRLTLADAITYAAQTEKADYIIDIATLTGAVVVALGNDTTGVMTDNERLWNSIEAVSAATEDRIWRLPVDDYFLDKVKSKRADLSNTGKGGAGTVTAGAFLREFALGTPWMHLDIAGTSYHTDENDEHPFGASGVGVELLAKIALDIL